MNENVENIINCLDILLSENKLSEKHLKGLDIDKTKDVLLDFMFLLSYPAEHKFDNKAAIETLSNESKMIVHTLFNDNEEVKFLKDYENKIEKRSKFKFDHFQKPKLLDHELQISKTDHFYRIYSSINVDQSVPMVRAISTKYIDNNKYEAILNIPMFIELSKWNKEDCIYEEDDTYQRFHIKFDCPKYQDYNAFVDNHKRLRKLRYPEFKFKQYMKELYTGKAYYAKVDDRLVSEIALENGSYDKYKNITTPLCSYYVLDQNKKELPFANMNFFELLREIRICIAHRKNKQRVSVLQEDEYTNCYKNCIVAFKDKSISIPEPLYERLCEINFNHLSYNSEVYYACYCPKFDYLLNTKENITKYLNACRKIKITTNGDVDFNDVDAATLYFLKQFKKKNLKVDLKSYLEEKLNPIFNNVTVKVSAFGNTDIIEKKIASNPWFKTDKKNYHALAGLYIQFITRLMYDFNIVKSNFISNNGKTNPIAISKFGILYLTKEFLYKMKLSSIRNYSDEIPFSLFKDEILLFKCILLGYINLISNNFDDDWDNEKSDLSDDQKFKIDLAVIVDKPNLFKYFRVVNESLNGNDREKNIDDKDHKLKKNIISTLRNDIAHFNIHLKYSRNGDIEDSELIFRKINSNNIYYKIKCKDFINFICDPIFMNHNFEEHKIIELNSIEEFKDMMITMSKNYKKNKKEN